MSKKTRRHHTPDQKIAMLRRHYIGKEAVSEICESVRRAVAPGRSPDSPDGRPARGRLATGPLRPAWARYPTEDYGGNCPKCGGGAACLDDDDCLSMVCLDGICAVNICVENDDCAAFTGPCTAGVCDGGSCVAMPYVDGTPCDDLQVCTAGPAGCAGVCVDPDGPTGPSLELKDLADGIGGFLESPSFRWTGLTPMRERSLNTFGVSQPDTTTENLSRGREAEQRSSR